MVSCVVVLCFFSVLVWSQETSESSGSSAETFLWGAAGASYQIEGCVSCEGRSPSIWDTFCSIPNNCAHNDTGEPAADDYELYELDAQLASNLSLNVYRLSISWSRILADGVNINQAGIDHYSNVFDILESYNIIPFVTIYHWDLPQSVYDITNGGWINSSIIDYYYKYADILFSNYNTRVSHWLTFNEPSSFCLGGYENSGSAPGRCSNRNKCKEGNSTTEPWICGHNVLLSHAKVTDLYHTKYQNLSNNGKIGITLNGDFGYPMSSSVEDKNASQRHMLWYTGWWGDPIYFGDYPQQMKDAVGDLLPNFTASESELLKGSSDFYGMNEYTGKWVANKVNPPTTQPTPTTTQNTYVSAVNYNGTIIGTGVKGANTWLWVVPDSIRQMLRWVSDRYNKPDIYITENGFSCVNETIIPFPEVLNDTCRISFYSQYLPEVMNAIHIDGINVKSYITWALLDNFEWTYAYTVKFGLYYIGYENDFNQTRYRKQSSYWFQDFIANNP